MGLTPPKSVEVEMFENVCGKGKAACRAWSLSSSCCLSFNIWLDCTWCLEWPWVPFWSMN